MTRIYYKTKIPVHNPCGDGRANKASWRSALDKTSIPAGFRWFLESEDGSIHDARHTTTVLVKNPGHLTLLANLQMCSDVVAENENDVLSRHGYPAAWALTAVCRAKGMTTEQLEEILLRDLSERAAAEEAEEAPEDAPEEAAEG